MSVDVQGSSIYITLIVPLYFTCQSQSAFWQTNSSIGTLASGCYRVYTRPSENDSFTRLATFCVGGSGNGSSSPLTSCLVVHWKLDESTGTTASDAVGSYPGVLHGGPVWQPTGGMIGGALWFDGVDDYVDLPIGTLLGSLHECTFAIWVNLIGSGANECVFRFGADPGVKMPATVSLSPNANGKLAANISYAGVQSPDGPLPSGRHHMAVVAGSDRIVRLYLDGVLLSAAIRRELLMPSRAMASEAPAAGTAEPYPMRTLRPTLRCIPTFVACWMISASTTVP